MTTLDEYLSTSSASAGEFARALGISDQRLSHFRTGRRRPSPEHAARIHELTNGQVSAWQWYPELLRVVEDRLQPAEEQAHG